MAEKITLRELRERAWRSIADVAAAIGVSYRTVGRIVERLAKKRILIVSRNRLRINEMYKVAE